MEVYYMIVLFILGTVLGSFFNVVGWRVPRKESIVKPASHCKKCRAKISLFYPIFELATGILFSLSYLKLGLNIDLIITLTFISTLLIIIISDYQTMII